MSVINVTVTNAGAANVAVSGGSTVNATVGNGGAVNVSLGTISPGNATVVSGTLTINSTTTLAAGSSAYVKNDAGTAYAAKLDIGIPAGPATLVSVGNTTTLAAGSNATVNGTTNGTNLTLAFGIPAGINGTNGVTPSFAIGNVVTGAAGSSASVTATATNGGANVTLDLTIPRGDPGTSGSNGTNGTSVTLSDGTPANLGTASAGTSNLAARADHIHSLPVIAYANLSGVPSNFPTNTTLVTGLNSSYSGINHGHNYVTSINGIAGALTLAPGPNVTISSNNLTLTIDSIGGGISQNDAVDGGDYVGEILGGITFATQPQSQTLTLAGFTLSFSALNVAATGTPSTWLPTGGTFVMNDISTLGAVSFNGSLLANYRRLDANGTQYAALLSSSDNGATWSEALSLDTHGGFGERAFDISRKISAASNGTRTLITTGLTRAIGSTASNAALVMRRVDGSNLSNATQTTQQYLQVIFLPSAQLFLAIDEGGSAIHRSADGVTWTTTALGYGSVSAVHVVNGIAVAVGSSGAYRSTNGVQWVFAAVYGETGASAGYRSSASSATRVVWIDSSGVARYSLDGAVWSVASSSAFSTGFSHGVTYAAGLFWAVAAASSSTVHTSPDGVTWTARTLPASSRVVDVAAASSVGPVAVLGTVPALATLGGVTTSANLTVSASTSSGNPVSFQWQSSLDAGSTWANVTNATTSTLSLTGLTSANTGTRYRAAASATGAAMAFSSSAILTVSG